MNLELGTPTLNFETLALRSLSLRELTVRPSAGEAWGSIMPDNLDYRHGFITAQASPRAMAQATPYPRSACSFSARASAEATLCFY